jgi:hypothetical protein
VVPPCLSRSRKVDRVCSPEVGRGIAEVAGRHGSGDVDGDVHAADSLHPVGRWTRTPKRDTAAFHEHSVGWPLGLLTAAPTTGAAPESPRLLLAG